MSDFQMVALVSSLAAASSVSGIAPMLVPRAGSAVTAESARRERALHLFKVQVLPDLRGGDAAPVKFGALGRGRAHRGQPGDGPRGCVGLCRVPYVIAD